MRVPIHCLIRCHLHGRFGGAPAVKSGYRVNHDHRSHRGRLGKFCSSNLCISVADVLTPLHSNKTIPANATHSKNRVRVRNTHIALVGGNCALADFHVTPPLGRSMATKPPWHQHHTVKRFYQFDRRLNVPSCVEKECEMNR